MAFENDGYLITDKRSDGNNDGSNLWTTESDWNNAQDINDIEVVNGSFQLATSISIIDGFEDGDISEYNTTTSSASVQTNTVWDGTYALKIDNPNGAEFMSSMSGLDNYPSQGDTFRVAVRDLQGDNTTNILFGLPSTPTSGNDDGYVLKFDNRGPDEIAIQKMGSGFTSFASQSVSIADDTWYEMELDWGTDGTMTLTLYDNTGSQVASCTGTDTTWDSGGFGFRTGNGGTSWYDYARIL